MQSEVSITSQSVAFSLSYIIRFWPSLAVLPAANDLPTGCAFTLHFRKSQDLVTNFQDGPRVLKKRTRLVGRCRSPILKYWRAADRTTGVTEAILILTLNDPDDAQLDSNWPSQCVKKRKLLNIVYGWDWNLEGLTLKTWTTTANSLTPWAIASCTSRCIMAYLTTSMMLSVAC